MWILSFADSSGNIFKEITYNDVIGNGLMGYEIKGNSIYVKSHKLAQDDVAVVCRLQAQNKNEDVVFTEKFDYLGNGRFSDLVKDSSIKSDEYIRDNNVDCSWYSE